jgi:8-oxo-dGTP diphosphatase
MPEKLIQIGIRLLGPVWNIMPQAARVLLVWSAVPKVAITVSAVCANPRREFLLLQHQITLLDPWDLPSGFAHRGEHPEAAMLRELHEETGLRGTIIQLLLLEARPWQLHFCYLVEVPDQTLVLQEREIMAASWHPLSVHDPRFAAVQGRALAALSEAQQMTDIQHDVLGEHGTHGSQH